MKVPIYDSGQRVCFMCGFVFETLDFENECNWYKRDLNRCNGQQSEPKGIRTVFETHYIGISPMMMDIIEAKYLQILKKEGKKVLRGKCRKSIIATCLFYTYQESDEFRTIAYIRNLFNLKQSDMSHAISKYMKAIL